MKYMKLYLTKEQWNQVYGLADEALTYCNFGQHRPQIQMVPGGNYDSPLFSLLDAGGLYLVVNVYKLAGELDRLDNNDFFYSFCVEEISKVIKLVR